MAEKLVLNADFVCKSDGIIPKKCAVEKVIEVSAAEFGRLIENPIKRNYYLAPYRDLMGFYDDSYHGVLLINEQNGDGLLVNSEGADYARYSQFIPNAKGMLKAHELTDSERKLCELITLKADEICAKGDRISEKTDELLHDSQVRELLRNAVCEAVRARPEIACCVLEDGVVYAEKHPFVETKLYCPLKFTVEPYDDCEECYEADSMNFVCCDDAINAKIRDDLERDEDAVKRGLAAYFHDENLDQKVYSAVPEVETRDGDIYGVITVKSYGELNRSEMIDLTEELNGTLADGWGEVFEQHGIRLGEDKVFVSFWSCGSDYFLKPETEIFPEQELNQGMGGIN